MTGSLREAYQKALRDLSQAGVATPGRDARDLTAWAAGLQPMQVALEAMAVFDSGAAGRLHAAVAARARGKPVAQIIGVREFWGREFRVTEDVLDPRPETETLIETALAGAPADRILDLGTGSGILAISLLAEWPDARAVAVDLSAAALEVAAVNADIHRVTDRIDLRHGDWFQPVEGGFDLIISNPPYIAAAEIQSLDRDVRDWEPHLALSPGSDGLAAYRELSANVSRYLNLQGLVILECGHQQAKAVAELFQGVGAGNYVIQKDLNGHDRCIKCSNFS
ncbi:MAG: peptide chain release factor N(5)-glutamine methyltransferase [Pseudomonadota bacterium]